MVAPLAPVEYFGANFIPGEFVDVVLVMNLDPGRTAPLENAVSNDALGLQIDVSGNFYIKAPKVPSMPGVYGVRVRDAQGNVIASTVLVIQAPPAK